MDPDLTLTLGVVLAVFSVPAMLAAVAENRAPRVSMAALIVAAAMIGWALISKPDGYRLADLPRVLIEVAARYLP